MSSIETVSSPAFDGESRGSSVSTRLQDEYEEMLRYAVVTPNWDPKSFPTKRQSPLSDENVMRRPQNDVIEVEEESSTLESSEKSESAPSSSSSSSSVARVALPLEMEDDGSGSPGLERGDDVDEDLSRLEHQLDSWTLHLKRNVLAEFGHMTTRITERQRIRDRRNQERHDARVGELQNELESAKELLVTYEESMGRKDAIVANLTSALQKQREKMDLQRNFCAWKIHHGDQQREVFVTKLARKHYWKTIGLKIWRAWHGILETKWKQRVERACQVRAEEVCHRISCEYEERIAELNRNLEISRAEVSELRKEGDKYEETMKRAFMRGVCALNLEAMTMFREKGEGDGVEREGGVAQGGWIPPNPVNVRLESGVAKSATPARARGQVFVEKHQGGSEGVARRHEKVPPARIGSGKDGKKLPTVKVVQ